MPGRADELEQLLKDVTRGIFGLMHESIHHFQLPPGAKPVIRRTLQEPGITISEISRKTGVAKSHVSKIVSSLSQKGMLEKRPDPSDRRLVRIYLTEHATERFEALRYEKRQRLAKVAAGIPAGKLDEIIDGLRTLKNALDAERVRGDEGKQLD